MSFSRTIGHCIYCPTSKGHLSREHVIPSSLIPIRDQKSMVLQKASCKKCRDITSAFEGHILNEFSPVRDALGLRTKHQKPETYPLRIEQQGKFKEIQVPTGDYPATIIFPILAPPAYMDGRECFGGVDLRGHWTIKLAGPSFEAVAKKHGTKKVQVTSSFRGHSYPRLIAKVAYCTAVAYLGLDGIEKAYVLPAILGDSNDIGQWVGCAGKPKIEENGSSLHGIAWNEINDEIIVLVRLFAKFGAPEYVVVVGRIAKGAQRKFK